MVSHWSDNASIVWNYFSAIIGALLNFLLICCVFKHTPQPMRVYATVIRLGAAFEFIYTSIAVIICTKMVAEGVSLIYVFRGAINFFPTDRITTPHICFFCYIFGVNSYLLTVLILLFSLIYRQRIVTNPHSTMSQLQVNCICYGVSFIAFVYTIYVGTLNPPSAEDMFATVQKLRPDIIESGWVYYVLYDATGFFEWIVVLINWFVLILGIICRIRVYRKLATLNMSSTTKQIQKNLMNILLIQIITVLLPMFTTTLHSVAAKWNEVQTPLIENIIVTLPIFVSSITPIATIYYIEPYRRAVTKYFPTHSVQPSNDVSNTLESATAQI